MNGEKQKSILLVEDEVILAMTGKMTLEKYGYKVITANTGEEAIKAFHNNKTIDLILMDIDLGDGIDGTQAAEIILQDHIVPIVFHSNHTEPEIVEKTENITAYGYVVKNSGFTVLEASIRMAFKLFEANRKIVESEERNSALLKANPDMMFMFDRDGVFIDYASGRDSLLAASRDFFIGKNVVEVLPPDIAELTHRKLQSAFESGQTQVYEYQLDINNEIKLFESRLVVCGESKALAIVRDITERKQAEETLRKNAEELAAAYEEMQAANEELETTSQALVIANNDLEENEEKFRKSLDFTPIPIALAKSNGEIIFLNKLFVDTYGYTIQEMSTMEKGFQLMYPDLEYRNFVLDEWGKIVEHAIKNNISTPVKEYLVICKNGEVKTVGISAYFERDVSIGLFLDITDRKKTEIELIKAKEKAEESEERLKLVLEGSKLGYWDWNIETGDVQRNYRWAEMLGYTLDEIKLTVKQWTDLIHPDDREKALLSINNHLEGRSPSHQVEYRMLTKDKQWKWIFDCANVVKRDEQGKPIRMSGTHTDITERKQAEEALAESNQYNIQIIQSVQEGIIVYDENLIYKVLNPFMEKYIGLSASQIIGKHPDELFPFLKNEGITQNLKKALNGETIASGDFPFQIPNTDIKGWASETSGPLRNLKGEIIGVIGTVRDITARKKVEETLKESEEKFRNLFQFMEEGFMRSNTDGVITLANNAIAKMFDYDSSDEMIGMLTINLFTNPDERANLMSELKIKGKVNNYEIFAQSKNGNKLWTLGNYKTIVNQKGEKIGTEGLIRDITERKQAENEIKDLLLEKEIILKEVHHRIKNNMGTINALLSLHAETINEPIAIAALEDASNRVQSMMVLYDKLYRSSDFQKITVGNYLPSLVDEILANFPNSKYVKIEKKINDFILDTKRIQPLGIIINELLTNIMKYAFIGRENGSILIEVGLKPALTVEDKTVFLIIQDNGNGIPVLSDHESLPGFGLMLINMLTKQLKGTMQIERKNGTRVSLEFKL
jgi:PAS domain S-box-containing protein